MAEFDDKLKASRLAIRARNEHNELAALKAETNVASPDEEIGHRACPVCLVSKQNSSANFPSYMTLPTWYEGPTICWTCIYRLQAEKGL